MRTGSFEVVLWPRQKRQIGARTVGSLEGSEAGLPRDPGTDAGPRRCGPSGRRRADSGGRHDPAVGATRGAVTARVCECVHRENSPAPNGAHHSREPPAVPTDSGRLRQDSVNCGRARQNFCAFLASFCLSMLPFLFPGKRWTKASV
ncbi:unnamed protein product [Ixodes pacificus]